MKSNRQFGPSLLVGTRRCTKHRMHTHTHAHTHTHTHTHTHKTSHARKHTHARTHARAHARTHIYTTTLFPIALCFPVSATREMFKVPSSTALVPFPSSQRPFPVPLGYHHPSPPSPQKKKEALKGVRQVKRIRKFYSH